MTQHVVVRQPQTASALAELAAMMDHASARGCSAEALAQQVLARRILPVVGLIAGEAADADPELSARQMARYHVAGMRSTLFAVAAAYLVSQVEQERAAAG